MPLPCRITYAGPFLAGAILSSHCGVRATVGSLGDQTHLVILQQLESGKGVCGATSARHLVRLFPLRDFACHVCCPFTVEFDRQAN